MSQDRGKMGLMALAALVPFAVIVGVTMSGNARSMDRGWRGGTSRKAVAGRGPDGRRLQTTTYDFATQLEMTVCLSADHSSESASSTPEQVRAWRGGGVRFMSVHYRSRHRPVWFVCLF